MPRHSAPARRKRAIVKPSSPPPAPSGQFADQLTELEQIRAGLSAGGDDAKGTHTLRVRGNTILQEMAATGVRYRLPGWLDKATRMKWPESEAPRKKKPRKPTPPPVPPVKHDSGWHAENGVLSREIETR